MSKSRRRGSAQTIKRDPKVVAFWSFMAVALVVAAGMYWATSARGADDSYASSYVPEEPAQYDYLDTSILGDSYTVGAGADNNVGYAKKIAAQLCWDVNIQGQIGTGYMNPGKDGKTTFGDSLRIRNTLGSHPKLIIVQGSTNDGGWSGVEGAAVKTFAALRAESPDSQIVVVGPTDPPSIGIEQASAVRDEVKRAADIAGVQFIDPIALGWLTDPAMYGADQLHPTNDGHTAYANLLRAELEKLGIPRLNACDAV